MKDFYIADAASFVGAPYRPEARDLNDFGGLAKVMPLYAALFVIVTFASVGVPGTNGFVRGVLRGGQVAVVVRRRGIGETRDVGGELTRVSLGQGEVETGGDDFVDDGVRGRHGREARDTDARRARARRQRGRRNGNRAERGGEQESTPASACSNPSSGGGHAPSLETRSPRERGNLFTCHRVVKQQRGNPPLNVVASSPVARREVPALRAH